LCRNCGGQVFLVEREGKVGGNSWPKIYADEHGSENISNQAIAPSQVEWKQTRRRRKGTTEAVP
jgi:hypothetical protein